LENPRLLASLPFASPSDPARAGTVLLLSDHTLLLAPSPELRAELEAFGGRVDVQALKWGSSLVVGSAAVGAVLYPTRLRPLAWLCFGLSGAAGVLGRRARRTARGWASDLLAPHPARAVRIVPEGGGLRFDIAVGGGPLLRGAFRLEPGEFAPFEAAAFLEQWSVVSGPLSVVRGPEGERV
jgi:hypothetical protein